VKGADEDNVGVSVFHEREGVKAWYMVQQGDKAFLHMFNKFLSRPWHEVV
jgi:hypothetical protein